MNTEFAHLVWGRFNPPTIGHKKLIEAAMKPYNNGKKFRKFVVLSETHNTKNNPLTVNQKTTILRKMINNDIQIIKASKNNKMSTIFQILSRIQNKHPNIHFKIVLGGDYKGTRFANSLLKLNYVDSVNFVNRPHNAPSATKLRKAASENNFTEARKLMNSTISNNNVKNIMKLIRNVQKLAPL